MIVAIHQPQYMPWLGYFDKMDKADVFVFLDTVQFKKNEFQNRNRIKGPDGPQWLTVPVLHCHGQEIREVVINNTVTWRKRHIKSLVSAYGRAPYFKDYIGKFEELLSHPWEGLSRLNIESVRLIASLLSIEVILYTASEVDHISENRDMRLVEITGKVGGDTYLAGPGGRDYMDMEVFEREGIRVIFQDFSHPVYPQLFGDFQSNLSALDLLFNIGREGLACIRREYDNEHSGTRGPSR